MIVPILHQTTRSPQLSNPGCTLPSANANLPAAVAIPELLDRLRAGCKDSQRRLVEEYSPQIIRLVRCFMPRGHALRLNIDSTDVEQETWLKFIKKLDTGWTCADGEALLQFLLSLTACSFKNLHRKFIVAQKRAQSRAVAFNPAAHDLPALGLGPAELAAWRDESRTFLNQLPAEESLLLMAMQKGIALVVVAGNLAISERSAERHLDRVRRYWTKWLARPA